MARTLSDNAEQVAQSRYFMEGEDWEKCTYRVADAISSVEKGATKYKDLFHQIICEMDFLPAGRILRNAGRPNANLLNCFVLSVEDSIESIGEMLKNALILWSGGGGAGIAFSALRPRNDPILGKGGHSSGLVSFLEATDAVAKTVESGGARRAAALACVDVSHPEILDFIDAKLVHGKLSHFNISINIDNNFVEAVEADGDWELKFNQKVYEKIKARKIWDKILNNMINSAEPGLLNTSNLYKNNSYYFQRIVSTNPCGEQALPNMGSCCLGSITLPHFVSDGGKTNWKKLEETISLSIRFLDDVIDVNKYTLTTIDEVAHQSRRVGLGFLGLAEYLFAKKVRYGSEESLIEIEKLAKFFRNCAYTTGIQLATEKGAFPKFDPVAYGKASFIRKLPATIRKEIKIKGTRCVSLLSIAPTGTISLLPEVSGGCEPLFARAYLRKDRVGKRYYVHPIYKQLIEEANLVRNKDIPDWFVDAFDLKPEDHLEVQSLLTRYIDSSISKTVNLPKETNVNQLSSLLLEYIYDLKGVTIYRDGSREGQVLNRISHEEVLKAMKDGKVVVDDKIPEEATKCVSGNCSI
jgi:ribonucleoside-diphosphate reductase alpha chain